MSIQRLVVLAGLLLLVGACLDGVAPRPAAPTLHFVRWAPGSNPQFTTVGVLSGGMPSTGGARVLRASTVLSLSRYSASFWAVRGQARSLQINYLSATGDTSQPFLQLTTTEPAYVPGRGDLAVGDSVLITVTVNAGSIGVSLEPTGLHFETPAQFQIWYTGANGDFNGDGLVDSTDARIEGQLMGLSYHEALSDPWGAVEAGHSFADKSFTASLWHFSEYAVSW